jgi:hypothetical protein
MLVSPVHVFLAAALFAGVAIAGWLWRPRTPPLPADQATAFRPQLLRREQTKTHATLVRKLIIALGVVGVLASIGAVFVSGRAIVITGERGHIKFEERFVFGEDRLRREDATIVFGDRTWIVNRSDVALTVITDYYSTDPMRPIADPPMPYKIYPDDARAVPVGREHLHIGPDDRPGEMVMSRHVTEKRVWVTW